MPPCLQIGCNVRLQLKHVVVEAAFYLLGAAALVAEAVAYVFACAVLWTASPTIASSV